MKKVYITPTLVVHNVVIESEILTASKGKMKFDLGNHEVGVDDIRDRGISLGEDNDESI